MKTKKKIKIEKLPTRKISDFSNTLEEKLDYIKNRIHRAAISAGRNPKNITLIAITKAFPVDMWEQALNVNLTIIGESRIKEAEEKAAKFSKNNKIELHCIGHLQTNKTRKAINIFDVIQTVDSINLAEKMNLICKENQKKQSLYLQINTGADPKKHGISVNKALLVAKEVTKMEHVILEGIMTIPPQALSVMELRSVYRKTREIRDKICLKINNNCKNISMGMSNDYEIAIGEGATHIRIGSGLFGPRPQ